MWYQASLDFFFPTVCPVCRQRAAANGGVLCLPCEFMLPRIRDRHGDADAVSQLFWGRAPVEQATSLFRFEKGSGYQALLHELKYRGNRRVGLFLGRQLGLKLRDSAYASCDMLVPVPLHPRRQRQRGYNQSALIASGLSLNLGIPVELGLLRRKVYRGSQTDRGRYERFENVRQTFCIAPEAPEVSGKKILLVDDVLTTGATLEACALEIARRFSCRLFAATACLA
jgi:ComF family protein